MESGTGWFVCGVGKKIFFVFSLYHRTELSDHLETIDSGLENLQQILNAQSINFDTSPFFDVNIVFNTRYVCMTMDHKTSHRDYYNFFLN